MGACDHCGDTAFAEDGAPCPHCDPEGDEYLPHNVLLSDGQYFAICCICERTVEVGEDELPDVGEKFYCMGSERCLP
jgi:hypothetical protein